MANIDELVVQINSNASSAVSGIDALATSLGKLKTATSGGMGLGTVSKNLNTLKSSLSGISSINGSLNGLERAIDTLTKLNGVKISSSLGNQLKNLNSALGGLNTDGAAGKIQGLVKALEPLTKLGKSNLNSIINPLKKLPETMKALSSVDMGAFTSKIRELTNALKPLADEMQKVSAGFSSFPSKLQKVTNATNNVSNSNNKASKSYTAFAAKLATAYMVIKKVAGVLGDCITETNSYIENVNLFNASMGEFAKEAQEYAEQVGEIMGIDPGEWMRNQGMFMTLATGFGVVSDRAYIMSKNLTQLGYDLSSFFNISYEDAMAKLQSGLAGELEPLRRIGYDLSVARLQQEAYTLGIQKKVSAMTQAEKAELRYHAILTQVTTAQGDMARTLEAPANQLRILKAQVTQAARAIGSIFIPILNAVLPYIIALVKGVRLLASAFANLLGFKMPEVDYSGIGSAAGSAEDLGAGLGNAADNAKKLQKYTMGFDELNVIDTSAGASGAGDVAGAGGGFDFELPEYDFIGKATESRVDNIINKLKSFFETSGTKQWLMDLDLSGMEGAIQRFSPQLKTFVEFVGTSLGWVYTNVLLPIAKWSIEEVAPASVDVLTEALRSLNNILTPVHDGITKLWVKIQPIIEWMKEKAIWGLEKLKNLFAEVADVLEEKGPKISGIISGIGDIIAAVWVIIKPILDVLHSILNFFIDLLTELSGGILGGLIDIVYGIIEIIAGVLTGDWERVWSGCGSVVEGVWAIIKSLIDSCWSTIMAIWTPIATWFNEKVVQPVSTFFQNMWTNITGFFSNAWSKIKGVWGVVCDWFKEKIITPIGDFFSGVSLRISQAFEGCKILVEAAWINVKTWFDEKVCTPLKETWDTCTTNIKTFFTNIWEDIKGIWEKVSTWFDEKVCTPLKDLWNKCLYGEDGNGGIKGFFTGLWDDIKGIWEKASTWFDEKVCTPLKNAWKNAIEGEDGNGGIKGFFTGLWEAIKTGVVTAMNAVIGAIEKAVNWIIDGLNGLIDKANGLVSAAALVTGADWKGITKIEHVKLTRVEPFADGGFPDTGQLFLSREAGPELVGTIGRRSAVANNDQIVEGIKYGVATANEESNSLLREQNSLLRELLAKETGTYLDGKLLTNSVEKYQRSRGRVLVTGGAY